MEYAKIKNGAIVKFPFTVNDLQEENPNINFGVVEDIISVYQTTEEGSSGSFLVQVEEAEFPVVNLPYEYIQKKALPDFIDGKYVVGWNVIQRSQQEIDAINLELEKLRKLRSGV